MRRLFRPLLVLLALVFLFEAWLWTHLAPVVAFIVARIPFRAMKAAIVSWIDGLPPAATLVVFIVPVLLLLVPLKFLEVWTLVHGYWVSAIAVLVFAKLIGVGVCAFMFDITRPKLLQLAWFRRLYDRVITWLDWAHAVTDPIKQRLRSYFRMWAPSNAGRTLRLLLRIRRHMQAASAAVWPSVAVQKSASFLRQVRMRTSEPKPH
jgi:hypothetical protein